MMATEDKKHKLNKLKEEHSALDEEIARLMTMPLYDQLAVQRLKKRKLKLKDEINKLKTTLIPDIIA
ncbi:MAG: hypothetical protein BGO67_11795 [Alphaproteobacteria bacterium 41-28]|nr:MAG: hypothetical protein BGO67_11795 [Alphaproteobacteria bacterium 41-28]